MTNGAPYDIMKIPEREHKQEGGNEMPSERESNEVKKSMAYDLLQIIDENPEKKTYTAEEVKAMIKAYISTATAK